LEQSKIIVRVATPPDIIHAKTITDEMASSAQVRGTGIAKRSEIGRASCRERV